MKKYLLTNNRDTTKLKRSDIPLIILLVLIVIFLISAVITLPVLFDKNDDFHKKAVQDSAYAYKESVNKYYLDKISENPKYNDFDGEYIINSDGYLVENGVVKHQIQTSGQKPSGGLMIIQNNEISSACVQLGDYRVSITNEKVYQAEYGECNYISIRNLFSKNKKAIFFGDSVAYGHATNGNGFGYYVNILAQFDSYTNAARNTAVINTETQGSNNIIKQIKANKNEQYDFVILEGGYGDLRDTPPLGSLTDSYVVSEFDTTTFAGAVEYSLYLVTKYWPNAKIGFIVSYDTPNSDSGVRSNHAETKKYWDILKAACDKWNVQYLDFFEGLTVYDNEIKTYSELFEVTSNKYLLNDYIHPTAKGYEFISLFIFDWMKTLNTYNREFDVIESE